MLDHLTENDVVFFLTPEIVFNSETSLTLKKIAETVTQGVPKAFAWITDNNMLQNHFVYFNRAGVRQLKERWKNLSFLNVGDKHIENLWYKIITDCGVKVVPSEIANMSMYCLRFKNNMDFNEIQNYNYLDEKRKQWTILREGV